MKARHLILFCTAFLLISWGGATALGDWSGAATGPTSASGSDGCCTWTSTLDPKAAIQMEDCPWMRDALDVQGYTEDAGWTITFGADLNGAISLTEYYAWVGASRNGGAHLELDYTPEAGGPAVADVHWIQAIWTNDPLSNYGARVYGEYSIYIDNYGNDAGNPYYDAMTDYPAQDWFGDTPSRQCDAACPCSRSRYDWEAQVFLATGDLEAKTLTLYEDGVWWGFELTCVPVPSAVFLGAMGLSLVGLLRRREIR